MARFTLPDLVDLNRLQRMAEGLAAAGGIPVRILGLDGNSFILAGEQAVCSQFHRACPLSSGRCAAYTADLPARLLQTPCLIEKCPNNLWEAAALVSIAGEPLCILLIGQFFLASELPDLNFFSSQAEAIGCDPAAYRAALQRVPFFSRARVEAMLDYYTELLRSLAESGLRRLEQQRTAHAVIQSEARWRSLVSSAPAYIATVGRKGTLLFLNRQPNGSPADALIGRSLYDLLPAEASEPTRQALQAVFERGQTVEYETQIPRPDGSRMWLRHNVGPVELEGTVNAALYVTTDVTETKRTEARLSYLSTHDALTGLYNRAFFESELNRLQVEGPFPVSIIMADVDGMKLTNDTHGHAAGDELLRRVAEVLHRAFRQQDLIARIGGDEFVVFLPGASAEVARAAVERVRRLIRQANDRGGGSPLRLSMGVHTAENGEALLAALQKADSAMYAEKPGRSVHQGEN